MMEKQFASEEISRPWYKSILVWAQIITTVLLFTFVGLFVWIWIVHNRPASAGSLVSPVSPECTAKQITILASTEDWIFKKNQFKRNNLKWEKKIQEHGADLVSLGFGEWMAKDVLGLDLSVPIMKNVKDWITFDMISNKKKLNDFCSNLGFGNLFPRKFEKIADIGSEDFPIMIKPSQGVGGTHVKSGYKIAWNENDFEGEFKDDTKYMYSEFIPGKIEAALHFVFANGKFIRTKMTEKQCKKEHGIDHKGDCNGTEEAKMNEPLKEKARAILTKMDYRGIGCFDIKYKNSDRSKPKILELNARICGSMRDFDDYGNWIRDWSLISLTSY
jgi:hypothetical protein